MNISWRLGVSGDFATASNWSPAAVPGPTDNAIVAVPGTYTVTSSINETVDSLSVLDKHATLFITGASSFSATNGVNDGTIIVDGSSLNISNALFLFPPAPGSFENSGKVEVTNTNNLSGFSTAFFSDETITNTPQGVLEANGANTAVLVGALTTIVGGNLDAQGANAEILLGAGATSVADAPVLDGTHPGNPVKIEGNAVIAGEDVAKFEGTIKNGGVITIEGGDFPWLVCVGKVTLEGGGAITMTNPAPSPGFFWGPSIFGGVLTNVDNTISGTGVIGQMAEGFSLGSSVGTFINEAKGTIDADASTPLLIAGVGPDTNAGLIEATQGGTLLIDGVTIDNCLKHEKGTVEAGQNSTVGLENATIVGGFVKTLSGSIIEAEQGSNTITGAHVKNAGTIGAESATLTIVGDVNNHNGNLDANNATLVIDGAVKGGTATLEGTGRIEFDGASSAQITFAADSDAILKLDKPHEFRGTISGLANGDYIDFANINFADNPTISYSSKKDLLTVTDTASGVTDRVHVEGPVGSFSAQSDGSGGTLITDAPPANVVAVSHDKDAFVFGHSESSTGIHIAYDEIFGFGHSQLAEIAALFAQAHQDGANLIAHDPIDSHAVALQRGHHFLL
jgi:hypothetical protein